MAIVAFIADQLSKKQILSYFLGTGQPFIKVTDFFNLCLVWNRGVSFGLFNSLENAKIIFLLVAILIVLCLIYSFFQAKTYYNTISLGLIIGGAIGNIWDRYKYGAVIDFIDVHYQRYSWPAFNIADSLIVIGILLLLFEKKMVQNEK